MSLAESLGAGWMFLVIIVLAILLVVFLIKKKQALATSLATGLAIFFVLTVGYVYIVNDIKLTSLDGLIEGTQIYFTWLFSSVKNLIDVTSYAIKLDWRPNTTGV